MSESSTGDKSQAAFDRARRVLVGGVNSPVRSFSAVGGTPPTIASAKGSKITDVDGNVYVDYVCSYGPAILGHANEAVVAAVSQAATKGTSYGAPTELETQLAEEVVDAFDSVEKVRFVSSGTEAAMSAIRLARGATGRNMVIKCIGGYHGHTDSLLVSAGSSAAALGTPSSAGVPAGVTAETLLVPYNDLAAVEAVMAAHGGQVACMLVEPVAGNMGVVPPAEGYLAGLRSLCNAHGSLLVFDEVMSGFRVAYGGAQSLYGVRPDMTILGKILGGGMPVGAFGASADIMSNLSPEGAVYQAGTLSGNPVAMAAGLATLSQLRAEGFYDRLEARSANLEVGLRDAAAQAGIAASVCFNRVGSMLCCFFTEGNVCDYDSAKASSQEAFNAFFHVLLAGGVYVAPSPYEAWFVSAAHSQEDIDQTVSVAARAFAAAAECM